MSSVECIEGSSETLEKGEDRNSLLEESLLFPLKRGERSAKEVRYINTQIKEVVKRKK